MTTETLTKMEPDTMQPDTMQAEAFQPSTTQSAVAEVRDALESVGRQMPEVARSTRSAVDDMFRAIETGSDERVSAGVTLSLGLAIGILLGGAPRLLVLLALGPVVAMGLVLQDRRKRSGGGRSNSTT